MWEFLLALFVGGGLGSTRTAQRLVRPILALFIIGVIVAGLVYAFIVFTAVSERNNTHHVSTHRPH